VSKVSKKQREKEARDALEALARPKGDALGQARRQLKTAAKVSLGVIVAAWALGFGFSSGLDSVVPLIVAAVLTLAIGIAAFLVRRNLIKSEEMGALLIGDEMSAADRAERLGKLEAKVEKGDSAAILAKAQLQMQDDPKAALLTLEKIDLEKAQKLIALQVRAMRGTIHLQLHEVGKARELADQMDLSKAPDPKSRAGFAAVVAEAWARSGNPIEASELLDKYDEDDKDNSDVRLQLLRARAFTCAHRQNIQGMKKALKSLQEISPQLAAMFVGQKRVHPLLEQEAMRLLQKSGLAPKAKVQFARR
jgi:hypothetical protein